MSFYYWVKDGQKFELGKSSILAISPAKYREDCQSYNSQIHRSDVRLKELQQYQSTKCLLFFLSLLLKSHP